MRRELDRVAEQVEYDLLQSALVGFAAQASIEERAVIEIADLLPAQFDMANFS